MSEESVGRVDLEKARRALEAMRKRYIEDPRTRTVTLRATAKLVKDAYIEGRIGRFNFTADEPPERGGDDRAPSPLEFFLIGAAF